MTDTTTAHQLYPAIRTNAMTIDRLRAVLRMALADMAETNHSCVYHGMDRADTVATARQTRDDVAAVIRRREVLDHFHPIALAEDAERMHALALGTQPATVSHGTNCPPGCCGAGVRQWR